MQMTIPFHFKAITNPVNARACRSYSAESSSNIEYEYTSFERIIQYCGFKAGNEVNRDTRVTFEITLSSNFHPGQVETGYTAEVRAWLFTQDFRPRRFVRNFARVAIFLVTFARASRQETKNRSSPLCEITRTS